MQKLFFVLTLAGCLGLTGSLAAEEDDHAVATAPAEAATPASHYESADRNADGKISVEEFRNRMTKVFFELDANGDGVLQEEESSAVLIAPHHEAADGDGDKTISHEEFMGHTVFLFDTVDSDADGHFTEEDLAAAGYEGGDA